MHKGGLAVAICVSLLSAGGAAWSFQQEQALQKEGQWLMARGNAQAEEYAQHFDETVAEAQLQTFAQRREVLERAHLWQRGQILGVMGAALGFLAAYALFLLKRLDDQLADAMPELRQESAPSKPASSDAEPALAHNPGLPR